MPHLRKFDILPPLALLVGGVIYLLWRSPTLWMFGWCEALGFGEALADFRVIASRHEPPQWVLYSFPDGVWAFAGTAIMLGIWRSAQGVMRSIWVSLIPTLAIGSEIGQGIGLIPGGFDLDDLVTCLVAICLAFAVQPHHNIHDISK